MTCRLPLSVARGVMAVLGMLIVSSALFAQPRPAITMRRHPTLLRSVWPADFNRDGHIDFVAGESGSGRVVVRLGNGGGGVGQAIPTGLLGSPEAIGDFDGDTFLDVVVANFAGEMWILPGLGNGRFAAARTLDAVEDFRFAVAAEMTGDTRLDLVIGHGNVVEVQPGLGDFTFGPTMVLPEGNEHGVSAAVVADLNRDRRMDLVVAQARESIVVYMNQGGLLFTATEISIERFEEPDEIHGLAAADMNRDGRIDLIVPHVQGIFDYELGAIDVLIGRGNGTFATAVSYSTTVSGPWTATTGDFNRDGRVDVAIGGRSWSWDDLSDIRSYWDSVTILPGRGDGTLGTPAPFRLDTAVPGISPRPFGPWVNAHHALRTADVNGDGHDDLVASPGALLLNRVNSANRPPTVDAGPDLVNDRTLIVGARISEPDWDWVRVEWRDESGAVVRRVPSFEFGTLNTTTLTVTVTDARGATAQDTVRILRDPANRASITLREPVAGQRYPAGSPVTVRWDATGVSSDAVFDLQFLSDEASSALRSYTIAGDQREFTWPNAGPPGSTWRVHIAVRENGGGLAEARSGPFTIDTASAGPFPWPHETTADLGAVGAPGAGSLSNGVFTVRGSGAGVAGTADEFHYIGGRFDLVRFEFTARITSIENISALTQAGLMVREDLTPGSRHAAVFLTPRTTNGSGFVARENAGGPSTAVAGPRITAPAWVKLIRNGSEIRAYTRKNAGDVWTFIGEAELGSLTRPYYVMLFASSRVDGRTATARFDHVTIEDYEALSSFDFNTSQEGETTDDGINKTIRTSGGNIWGRSDSFRFHYTFAVAGKDESITARIRSLTNTNPLAKAGVMMRESATPGSPHVSLFVTPEGGIRLQYRTLQFGESGQFAQRAGTAPVWLRMTRSGDVFTGFASNDGVTWTRVGAIRLVMREFVYLGVAVTSNNPDAFTTAVVDEVQVTRER